MADWPHSDDKFSEEDFLAFLVFAGPPPTEYNTLYRTAMLRARMDYIGQADAFCLTYFGSKQRAAPPTDYIGFYGKFLVWYTCKQATDAICGMAKDYRLLEEKNHLLRVSFNLLDDQADILRDKLSAALEKCSGFQLANGALAMDLARAQEKVTQCVRCEHPEYHEAGFSLSSRTIEREETDIELVMDTTQRIDKLCDLIASKAPRLYGNFFDVLMWRWVFNTVRL